jgi:SMODS-associating 2TM, beta-strand rich effector domain
MHPYSTNSEERSRIPFFVACIAFLLAWVVAALVKKVHSIPFYVEIPGTFTLYGVLLEVLRSYCWRWKWLRSTGIVSVPDLDGEWHGHVTSSFGQAAKQHPVKVNISQNWTHMAIHLRTDGSRSRSVVASLYVADDETVLSYIYENEPNVTAKLTMHAHGGTATLFATEGDCKLAGDYYSGRDRNNHGQIVLRRFRGRQ